MKLRSVAMALTAGLVLIFAGCSPAPDYTAATISYFNPWAPTDHKIWVVEGSSVQFTETQPDGDGTPQASSLEYELTDQDAFYKALHRALNAEQKSMCSDAQEYTLEARDQSGVRYGNNLQQCGEQDTNITDLLNALDADRA